MEDKSLSLWEIPLGLRNKSKGNSNKNQGFKFGETKMEYYKRNDNLKKVFKNH